MSIDDYEIIKQIGNGTFSKVSLIKRKKDGNIFALKRIELLKMSEKEKENSLNEIRLLASINHRNIISYKDSFYEEKTKTLNIILEYADDGDLQSKITSHKIAKHYFNEKTIWSIFIQMVNGLKQLHEKNIIHRDLKSANIFLMKNGICKLGDLNVSKIAKCGLLKTQTGTPYFASPEIWTDHPYDIKSDIWSLGCILYQMTTLKMPFNGNNYKEVYNNVMSCKYNSIPKIYSNELAEIIQKLLQINPKQRPTCDQILNDNIVIQKLKFLFSNNNNDNNNFFSNDNNKLKNIIKSNSNLSLRGTYDSNLKEEAKTNEYSYIQEKKINNNYRIFKNYATDTSMKDDNKIINISKESNISENKKLNSMIKKNRKSSSNSLKKNEKLDKSNSYLSNGTPSKFVPHPRIFNKKSKISGDSIPKSSNFSKTGRYSYSNKNSLKTNCQYKKISSLNSNIVALNQINLISRKFNKTTFEFNKTDIINNSTTTENGNNFRQKQCCTNNIQPKNYPRINSLNSERNNNNNKNQSFNHDSCPIKLNKHLTRGRINTSEGKNINNYLKKNNSNSVNNQFKSTNDSSMNKKEIKKNNSNIVVHNKSKKIKNDEKEKIVTLHRIPNKTLKLTNGKMKINIDLNTLTKNKLAVFDYKCSFPDNKRSESVSYLKNNDSSLNNNEEVLSNRENKNILAKKNFNYKNNIKKSSSTYSLEKDNKYIFKSNNNDISLEQRNFIEGLNVNAYQKNPNFKFKEFQRNMGKKEKFKKFTHVPFINTPFKENDIFSVDQNNKFKEEDPIIKILVNPIKIIEKKNFKEKFFQVNTKVKLNKNIFNRSMRKKYKNSTPLLPNEI